MDFIAPSCDSNLGVIINNVQLSNVLQKQELKSIRKLWVNHGVAIFPKQNLNLQEYENFSAQFGPFGDEPFLIPMQEHPHIVKLHRKPDEEEIERYLPFLKSHIEIINPKILILLGSTALNALIGNEEVISKARGKWIQKEIGSSKPWVIASFHPAFLMRQPEQKKLAWIDLKMIREKSKILKI